MFSDTAITSIEEASKSIVFKVLQEWLATDVDLYASKSVDVLSNYIWEATGITPES